jgi:CheY-like chemotaxis protein
MSKVKVLVVDDSDQVRRAYERMLKKEYDYRIESDGLEALQIVRGKVFVPDIIVSDYDMGVGFMTGAQLCAQLRAESNRVPFILASGNLEVETLARECGASYGLLKPIMPFQLDQLVKRLVPAAQPPCLVE